MKVSELLNCHQKWCKGDYVGSSGRICLSEAVDRSYPNHAQRNNAYARLEKALKKVKWFQDKKPLNPTSIVGFNDDPKTTFKDIQMLLKAAKE